MVRFKMPTNAAEILKLVDDANRLHDEKVKLEALANGMMADGKPPAKTSKPTASAASSSTTPNPWTAAMSVEAVTAQAKKKPKGIAHPPPKTESTDSDDSEDDAPLKFKMKSNGAGAKKTIKKKDKEPKEKKFKKVTAYNIFVGQESTRLRALCKEEGHPVVTAEDKKELMSKVGALWGKITDEEKVPWQKLADERNEIKRAEFEGRAPPPAAAALSDGPESEDHD